ncbi:unnamed protein product [Rangifer tarandus platyrhynchus]|uniref:Uncharacterized protein n=2 Tax=Rangifer tarandus platyrhynchus TaxID=3082113 RepID=A0ABN9A1V1_RANTA|nr:unnamed protein product [Rangifer tarandus platyrhynchus]
MEFPQPLAAPHLHPGPRLRGGLSASGPDPTCLPPPHPSLSSDELPGARLHVLDGWQCLSLTPPFFLAPTQAFAASFTFGSLCMVKAWARIWLYPESQNLPL